MDIRIEKHPNPPAPPAPETYGFGRSSRRTCS